MNEKYKQQVINIAETILVIKGTIKEVLSLEYRDDLWFISAELDTELMKRNQLMGIPGLWLKSLAISHSGYLVFNIGTRALVHNALIPTETLWSISPNSNDWLSDLEQLKNTLLKEDTKSRLTHLNLLLLKIHANLQDLEETQEYSP